MRTLDYTAVKADTASKVINNLNQLLADLQVHYTNLRNLHWNIKGHGFFVLHAKYEEMYDDIAAKVDEVAERILQLGGTPEHKFSAYLSGHQRDRRDGNGRRGPRLPALLDAHTHRCRARDPQLRIRRGRRSDRGHDERLPPRAGEDRVDARSLRHGEVNALTPARRP